MNASFISAILMILLFSFILYLISRKNMALKSMNHHQWYYFIWVVFFWMAIKMTRDFVLVYAEDILVSSQMLILIGSAYGLISIFVRLPLGIISDFLKNKVYMIQLGMVLLILANLLVILNPAAETLYIINLTLGIAASTWGIVNVIFTELFQGEYKVNKTVLAISVLSVAPLFADFAVAPLQKMALDNNNFSLMYIWSTIFALITIIMAQKISLTVKVKNKFLWHKIKAVIVDKNILIISLIALIILFIKYSTVGQVGQLMATELNMSNTGQAYLSTIFALTQMIAGFILGVVLTKKFSLKKLLILGILLTSGSTLISGFIPLPIVFFIMYGIHGFGFGLVYNLLMAMSIDRVSEQVKATYMGLFQTIYAVGIFLGPTFAIMMREAFSLNLVYIIAGIISLFLLFLIPLINFKK